MPSRELYELREHSGGRHERDLLCVGGMGHAVSIAAGISLALPKKRVVCLDGDGAMLMQLGAITNSSTCKNLIHIVLNNGAHDSVGGQPTRALHLDLSNISIACGYGKSLRVKTVDEIQFHLNAMLLESKSCFLEILCRRGNRADLGRPKQTPAQNRDNFMRYLGVSNEYY
jgi:phosphonopyruvate decarboxylase